LEEGDIIEILATGAVGDEIPFELAIDGVVDARVVIVRRCSSNQSAPGWKS
jgi:hypothetical protein